MAQAAVTVKTNLPDFRRQMAEMKNRVKPIVAAATRAAALEFRDDVRALARRRSGQLRRAVVAKRAKRGIARGVVHYIVGLRLSRQNTRGKSRGRKAPGDVFYWRFLEQGWVPRRPGQALRGGVESRRKQRRDLRAAGARVYQFPFLEPAFRTAQGKALKSFYAKLDEGIAKEAARR